MKTSNSRMTSFDFIEIDVQEREYSDDENRQNVW